MAANRAYTTIEQSRKMIEILPLESADMYYFRQIDNDYFPPDVESICPIPLFKDGKENFDYDIRCWSISALLEVISNIFKYNLDYDGISFILTVGDFEVSNKTTVDACVTIIEKLHENKLL